MQLGPQMAISERELSAGIGNLVWDAAFATVVGALNSGVVLVAFALHLDANNAQIGILAAIPLLTQLLQAPAVVLVERVRARKLVSVVSLFTGRLALPVYAAIPFIDDRGTALNLLILAALVHYGFNAVAACSWNSWVRDLIPDARLGQFFARRSVYATAASTIGAVVAGVALDSAAGSEEQGDRVFTALYIVGFLSGLISNWKLAQVPEPRMQALRRRTKLIALLARPLQDRNFRNMMRFMASWQFAVNLATPFFTVYFVRELGFGIGFVMALTVVSQLANLLVLRSWGALSDRFANKSVLSVAVPLFLLCIAGMVLADEVVNRTGRAAYLIGLHILMGFASAGVGLASGNIALKLSPAGDATSYIAANALVSALAAGIAPILGGYGADFFAARGLELAMTYIAPGGVERVFDLLLTHWEFFFLLAAALGLYTLHRLSLVSEAGEIDTREMMQHVFLQARRTVRNLSPVAGLRLAVAFPGGELIAARQRRKEAQAAHELMSGWAA